MAKYVKTEEGYKKYQEVEAINSNKMDKANPTGTGSFSLNRKSGTIVGSGSFAEGYSTTASDKYSHAEGNSTTASNIGSHAEGYSTTASGAASHAEGESTTASSPSSHSEGRNTTASNIGSHAEGYSTTASGAVSHAEGYSTNKFSSVVTATNPTNDAIITAWKNKKFSLASGSGSHVEGKDNLALADYSHAEGRNTTASDNYSHAEGAYTTASGNSSHAEGSNTTASDFGSHAEGYSTTASGSYSHAEGESTTASSPSSHAEGSNTTASGAASHAEGQGTTASGSYSHAEGVDTTASGEYSHAEGLSTTASSTRQHVQGKYNIADSSNTYADIIGNGTSDTARSNVATVDWSGNAWYAGDVYVGSTSGTNKDEGSKKLATEEYVNSAVSGIPSIPTALPNPYALTFTGAVTGSYDGSQAVTVEIPSGGGSGTAKTQKLIDVTLDEATASISVTLEHNFHRLFLVWDSGSNGVARIVNADGNAISSALTVLLDTTTVSWNALKVGMIATDTSTYKSDALIMEWTDDASTYIRSNRYSVQSSTSSSVYNTFGGYSAMAGTLGTAEALTPVAGRTVNIVASSGYFAPTTKIKLVGEYYE